MHRFIDFKGFADTSIDLFRSLTVLIGKNGSGKSNTIEGIELLSNIAQGRPLYEITDVGRGTNSFELRGGLAACPRGSRDSFALNFSGAIKFEGKSQSFLYAVRLRTKPEPRIALETLYVGSKMIFESLEDSTSESGAILRVRFNNFARGGLKPTGSLPSHRSVLSQYDVLTGGAVKAEPARQLVAAIRNYLRASFTFDPNPKMMRSYERIGQRVLARDGANLSAVLYALEQGTRSEKETLVRILNWIQQLPEEPFSGFGFVTTRQNDVLFGFRESNDSLILDARVLSDGTLRCLAVLTALETCAIGSRIVIEEFDNGLHPSRVKILIQAITDCSKRRRLNVLVTTHNPATLNELEQVQLDSVVLCFWDKAQRSSRLVPLMQLPRADVLLERGHLGDLVSRQVVEQYLEPNYEERHKQKAKAWLDALP